MTGSHSDKYQVNKSWEMRTRAKNYTVYSSFTPHNSLRSPTLSFIRDSRLKGENSSLEIREHRMRGSYRLLKPHHVP